MKAKQNLRPFYLAFPVLNIQKAEQIAILEGYQPMPQKTTPITVGYRSIRQFPVKGFPDGLEIFQTSFTMAQLLGVGQTKLNWQVHEWEKDKQNTSISSDTEASQGYQRRTEITRAVKFGNYTKYENNCLSSYYFAVRKNQSDSPNKKIEIDRRAQNTKIEGDTTKIEVDRRALMERIKSFSDS